MISVVFWFQGDELLHSLEEIKDQLPKHVPFYVSGKSQTELDDFYTSLDDLMNCTHGVPICRSFHQSISFKTPLCFIYTSGTTGN